MNDEEFFTNHVDSLNHESMYLGYTSWGPEKTGLSHSIMDVLCPGYGDGMSERERIHTRWLMREALMGEYHEKLYRKEASSALQIKRASKNSKSVVFNI